MDSKDKEILKFLKEDGRASYTEIAQQTDVSEGTVRNRVEKMKEDGVIERFTVETSQGISAVVLVEIDTSIEPEKVIEEMPKNTTIYEVTGEHDLVMILDREETEELNDAIDDIRSVGGVEQTITKSVLKQTRT